MESSPKELTFGDDSKQLVEQGSLRVGTHMNPLQDLPYQLSEPQGEPNIQVKYYQEFKKIYLTSYKLWKEVRKQLKIKDSLANKIGSIESQLTALHKTRRLEEQVEVADDGQTQRKNAKRTRRTAEEIERKYNCSADFCGRCYGSEGSLQQHIKLKHPEIYKKENDSNEY